MNLKDLLDRDGIKLKKQSFREFSGSCPWCGGRDRLRVWPDEDGGRFWCRACNKGGDMIKYHMLTAGVRYFDACIDLGVEPKFKPRTKTQTGPRISVLPSLAWRTMAKQIIDQCAAALFTDQGEPIREFLADRGITEKTAHRARLGLNPGDQYFDREAWGLDPMTDEDTGKPKRVWLPAGLVIPTYHDGEPARIRVRRAAGDPRYVCLSGSSGHPMRYGRLAAALVIESELDAILCSQAAGDLVMAVALGSAQARPDAETDRTLKQCGKILLALDYDEAGAAQVPWWKRAYGSIVRRWPTPKGKDPAEAYVMGIDLREWVRAGLS